MNTSDLTRWNRQGLSRFQYVNGNGVTFLEQIRLLLLEKFRDPYTGELQWQRLATRFPPQENESQAERMARLRSQYIAEPDEFSWEIVRTLARSNHILSEYINHYANESFLGTATQWDNVRRLVAMLDYHPAPPASAETWMALILKEEKKGKVERGFQVQHQPQDGSPLVFESLADLQVDAELNTLYARDWNISADYLNIINRAKNSFVDFPLKELAEKVSVGDMGVLSFRAKGPSISSGLSVRLVKIENKTLTLRILDALPAGISKIPVASASLFLKPEKQFEPRLYGDRVIELDGDHSLEAGGVISWRDKNKAYQLSKVLDTDGKRIKLSGKISPQQGAEIYSASIAGLQSFDDRGTTRKRLVIPRADDLQADTVWTESLSPVSKAHVATQNVEGTAQALYQYVTVGAYQKAYYLGKSPAKLGKIIQSPCHGLEFSGSAEPLTSSQWGLAEKASGELHAVQIESITQQKDSFILAFKSASHAQLNVIYAKFESPLRPLGHDKNHLSILTPASKDSVTQCDIQLHSLPSTLRRGRSLLIDDGCNALKVKVLGIHAEEKKITVEPGLASLQLDKAKPAWRRFETTIRANVLKMGHGESKPKKNLGSGNATVLQQSFVLKEKDISYTSDREATNGVSPAIDVWVAGERWQRVNNFHLSEASDHHYGTALTDEGFVRINFGDGIRGRRLPTGKNNVVVTYRVGTGLQGNVAARSEFKLRKNLGMVGKVDAPLVAVGGSNQESIESLRESAPASVLCLARAVSLNDFAHLASQNSKVWQAISYRKENGYSRAEKIGVSIVPASGLKNDTLLGDVRDFLQAAASSGVKVFVENFESVCVKIGVKFYYDAQRFDLEQIESTLYSVLNSSLNLKNRSLGEALYRSELYALVEGVLGVSNSHISVALDPVRSDFSNAQSPMLVSAPGGVVKTIKPYPHQVVYVSESSNSITLTPIANTQGGEA